MERKSISAQDARKLARDELRRSERLRQEDREEHAALNQCPDCAALQAENERLRTIKKASANFLKAHENWAAACFVDNPGDEITFAAQELSCARKALAAALAEKGE